MNQCDDRIKDLLPLYADQELTSDEKALVDKHILTCADCAEELQLYIDISDELNIDSIEAPKGFHKDLVNKLNLMPIKSKPNLYKRYNKYINVAAMLVFVLFLSVVGLTQGNKWGQSSDEALMEKVSVQSEMTTDETREETREEVKGAEKSEAKMEMKEDSTEAKMETKEESAPAETKMAESIEMDSLNEDVVEDVQERVVAEEVQEETLEITIEESKEIVEPVAEIMENTSTEETLINEAGEEAEVRAYTTDDTITLTTEEKENHLQSESPKTEAKPNLIWYIALVFVSILVGGSVFYYIRKRILKN